MKRDEILARVSGGETVFREGGFEVSYCIGQKRGEASPIRADQFGYLLDAGLISEARKERGQPWYQTRWKRAARSKAKPTSKRSDLSAPPTPSIRRRRSKPAPPAFGVGGGWAPYFYSLGDPPPRHT